VTKRQNPIGLWPDVHMFRVRVLKDRFIQWSQSHRCCSPHSSRRSSRCLPPYPTSPRPSLRPRLTAQGDAGKAAPSGGGAVATAPPVERRWLASTLAATLLGDAIANREIRVWHFVIEMAIE
jgi:hypothetical protein